jgi:hypothetical protein
MSLRRLGESQGVLPAGICDGMRAAETIRNTGSLGGGCTRNQPATRGSQAGLFGLIGFAENHALLAHNGSRAKSLERRGRFLLCGPVQTRSGPVGNPIGSKKTSPSIQISYGPESMSLECAVYKFIRGKKSEVSTAKSVIYRSLFSAKNDEIQHKDRIFPHVFHGVFVASGEIQAGCRAMRFKHRSDQSVHLRWQL